MISADNPLCQRQIKDRLCFYFFLLLFFIACVAGGLWGNSGSGSIVFSGLVFTGAGFVLIYSAIWTTMLFLFFYFPFQGFDKKNLIVIIVLAVAARGLIFFQIPSDDLYRYLWEGRLFADGINPYLFSPDHPGLKAHATGFWFHSLINHPDIPAAYPPFIILFFSLITRLSLSLYFFKFVMVLFDLGSILFLAAIMTRRRINIRWLLVYALNPLILYSFAGEGHFDAIQNFFLLGALFCYDRKKWVFLFIFSGLAIQVKYVALIALPFFINRDNFKFLPIVLVPLIGCYLPFLTENPLALFTGISRFEGGFAFNGSVHSVIRDVTGKMSTASLTCRILFICFMASGFLKLNNLAGRAGAGKTTTETDPIKGILYAFSCLIILSPTIHIWYLSWVLPFAVIRNTASWLVLSLTACFYYVTKSVAWSGGEWALPFWAQILEWLPFYIFFGFELYYALKQPRRNDQHFNEMPESLSVIIPVLNEENKIESCIQTLKQDPGVSEIIVVDGGSKDKTVNTAVLSGARVIIHKKGIDNGGGRGGQIIKGIKAATGDIIAVVHADTLVCSPVFSELTAFLRLNPDVAGGAVGAMFDTFSFKTKFIEFLNGLRIVFFGISFGDQIQFFRRKKICDHHLFPDIPLMEDVEFSLQLPKAGRRAFLFGDALVSSRRWERTGIGNFFMVLRLFFTYLVQRIFKMPDVVTMYRYYYK